MLLAQAPPHGTGSAEPVQNRSLGGILAVIEGTGHHQAPKRLGIEGGGIAIADRAEVTTGDEIFNPRTGQRMAFPRTAADSGGEDLIIECWSPPEPSAAAREPLHVHPEQT